MKKMRFNWIEFQKYLQENKIYPSDVITSWCMDSYIISDKDNFDENEMTADTYNIIATFVCNWLDDTTIESELADTVIANLISGLEENKFTLDDIENDRDSVRNYINSYI